MGNAPCAEKRPGVKRIEQDDDISALCSGRTRVFPKFVPPAVKHATFAFDYERDRSILLSGEERQIAEDGFLVEAAKGNGCVPRWWIVKEYAQGAAGLSVCISGRLLVHCPALPTPKSPPHSHYQVPIPVFQACTRGCPVYSSVRTQSFRHVAQVATSGVFFAVSVLGTPAGLYLCPKISLLLESGDEVVLVEDRLGPLRTPQSFYVDFAAVDDGGRDVQLDLIFRGAPKGSSATPAQAEAPRGRDRWTLRTCLHDYATLNSQVAPASVVLGYSGLASAIPGASVYLQNFVMNEAPLRRASTKGGAAGEPQPFDLWKEAQAPTTILFEGKDARLASMALVVPEAPVQHPQLQPASSAPPRRSASTAGAGPDGGAGGPAATTATGGMAPGDVAEARGDAAGADEFWYHFRYADGSELSRSRSASGNFIRRAPVTAQGTPFRPALRGEFWLSRQEIERKNTYFYCSSTLAQALSMCIIFRFRCPQFYHDLIKSGSNVLKETHIPSSGLVLGIERDPRNGRLMRMFAESRNEIVEDMVVCECRPGDLSKSVVHQEVYDNGSTIVYRLTLLHGDGARQMAVLQQSVDVLDDGAADAKHGGGYHVEEEPSSRFPVSPISGKHELTSQSYVLVYTANAFSSAVESGEDAAAAVAGDGELDSAGGDDFGTAAGTVSSRASQRDNNSVMSDAEDWQSLGGGGSDAEADPRAGGGGAPAAPGARGGANWPATTSAGSAAHASATAAEDRVDARWRRPLIDSAVLLGGVEQQPFAVR
eukprot:TRINITY_DN30718_c0_g1_i2.p1 TRINITY_DN30718_c0_g1~~TRINITY_DN30718_c0_g1_i2.p1  ORF type:complete len:808 (-),score=143.16 TRINITY_DN30718_c0_g1_i2:153-2453(-)